MQARTRRFPLRSAILLGGMLATLPAEDIAVERLTLDDGRVLVGVYDEVGGKLGIVDEKNGRTVGTLGLDPASVTKREPLTITVPDADPLDRRGLNGSWLTSYDAALALAAETRRPIFVLFDGSDWCSWCEKLHKEILETPAFRDWAKTQVVLLYLDLPLKRKLPAALERQNTDLARKWGNDTYPSLYFVDAKGEKYDWKFGYNDRGVDEWLKWVEFSRRKLVGGL